MDDLKVNYDDTLYSYLRNNLPNKDKNNIKKLLSSKEVFVNDKMKSKYDTKVQTGDIISFRLRTNNLDILYEDDDFIAINKKAGLLTVATNFEREHTLYHQVSKYVKTKNKQAKIFVLHRLDKDTSGVVIFAKNSKLKNLMQENWDNFILERGYLAVIKNEMPKKAGTLENYLNIAGLKVYVTNKKNGKKAITNYEVLKTNGAYSLVKILLKTGRKNQIRVQFANAGRPILGDTKYGDDKADRLYLHANRLIFYHPIKKMNIVLDAKLPKSFEAKVKKS